MNESAPNPGDRIPPDELIDALFDGELSPRARREVLGAVRHDARAGADLERTARVLAALRAPPEAPDLTDRILHSADHRRRFVPGRLRRMTKLARAGVVVLALVVMLGVAAGRRAWPEATTLADEQTPLADVNEAFRDDAAAGVGAIRSSVHQVRMSFQAISTADPCVARLEIEAAPPHARMLTAGFVTNPFGIEDERADAPASIRCGAPRIGAGPTIWVGSNPLDPARPAAPDDTP